MVLIYESTFEEVWYSPKAVVYVHANDKAPRYLFRSCESRDYSSYFVSVVPSCHGEKLKYSKCWGSHVKHSSIIEHCRCSFRSVNSLEEVDSRGESGDAGHRVVACHSTCKVLNPRAGLRRGSLTLSLLCWDYFRDPTQWSSSNSRSPRPQSLEPSHFSLVGHELPPPQPLLLSSPMSRVTT